MFFFSYTDTLFGTVSVFMTFAWYGHLKFKDINGLSNLTLPVIILISWGIALFEYC
ncbi:MAG: DMT family protein, partial [Bacteroidaceae bacterium]